MDRTYPRRRQKDRPAQWICTVSPVCPCSGSEHQCDCRAATKAFASRGVHQALTVDICEHCDAPMVLIDFATGQLLESKAPAAPTTTSHVIKGCPRCKQPLWILKLGVEYPVRCHCEP